MGKGRPRHDLLVSLARVGPAPIVDVGADHGKVGRAIAGCIRTERQPHRRAGRGERWVIADGLKPFSNLGTVVIAGMGALTIASILDDAPRVERYVLHAPDDPPRLRQEVAARGLRIVEEHLAPEAGRYAEVLVVEPGTEGSSGVVLEMGPRLVERGHPLLVPHFEDRARWYAELIRATADHNPDKHDMARQRLAYIEAVLGT